MDSLEPLIKAIREGKLNVVQKLIAINKKLVLEKYSGSIPFEDEETGNEAEELLGKDMTGMNSIHIALMSLDIEDENVKIEVRKKIIEELIQALPNDIDLSIYRWGNNNTTLHLASFLGERSIINKILNKGENPSFTNDLGKTSIDVAADYELSDYLNEINEELIEKKREELKRKESLLNTLKKCEDIETTLNQNKQEKLAAESKVKIENKEINNENNNNNTKIESMKAMEEKIIKEEIISDNNSDKKNDNKDIQNSNETITCENSNPFDSNVESSSNNTINNTNDSNLQINSGDKDIKEEIKEEEIKEVKEEIKEEKKEEEKKEEVKKETKEEENNETDKSSIDRSKFSNLIDMDMINNLINSQAIYMNADNNIQEEEEEDDDDDEEGEEEEDNENIDESKINININKNTSDNMENNNNNNNNNKDNKNNNIDSVISKANTEINRNSNTNNIKATVEKINSNGSKPEVSNNNIRNQIPTESVASKKNIFENNNLNHEVNKVKENKISSTSFNTAKENFANSSKSYNSSKEFDTVKTEIMAQNNNKSIKSIINNINNANDNNNKLQRNEKNVILEKDDTKVTMTNINKNNYLEKVKEQPIEKSIQNSNEIISNNKNTNSLSKAISITEKTPDEYKKGLSGSIKEAISKYNNSNSINITQTTNEPIKLRETIKTVKINEKSENVESTIKKDIKPNVNELNGSVKKRERDISKLIQAFNQTPNSSSENAKNSFSKQNIIAKETTVPTSSSPSSLSTSTEKKINNIPSTTVSHINTLKSAIDNKSEPISPENKSESILNKDKLHKSIEPSGKGKEMSKVQLLSSKFLSNVAQNTDTEVSNNTNVEPVIKKVDESKNIKAEEPVSLKTNNNITEKVEIKPKTSFENTISSDNKLKIIEKPNLNIINRKKSESKIDAIKNSLINNMKEEKPKENINIKNGSKIDAIKNSLANNNKEEEKPKENIDIKNTVKIDTIKNSLSNNTKEEEKPKETIDIKSTSKIDAIKNSLANNTKEEEKPKEIIDIKSTSKIDAIKNSLSNNTKEEEKPKETIDTKSTSKIDAIKNSLANNTKEEEKPKETIDIKSTSKIDAIKNSLANNTKEEEKPKENINIKSTSKIDAIKNSLTNSKKETQKEEISNENENKEKPGESLSPQIQKEEEKEEEKEKEKEKTTTKEKEKSVNNSEIHENLNDINDNTTISISDLTLNESNEENNKLSNSSKLKEKSKLEDDYTSDVKPDNDFSLQFDSLSLDLPTIASVTLSLDEILVAQDMNFSSMFSDFDLSKSNTDSPIKDVKASNNTDLDLSDNTLYNKTESNESINKTGNSLKKPLEQKEIKSQNKVERKIDENKENLVETSVTKREKDKEANLNKNTLEKVVPKEKMINKLVSSEKEKVVDQNRLKEDTSPKNESSKEKEIQKEVKKEIVIDKGIKKEEEKEIHVEKKIDSRKEDNVKKSNSEEISQNNNEDGNKISIESQPKTSENDESLSLDPEKPSEIVESDNNNNEAAVVEKQKDKHSNMVLKEKLYDEQKNHNKIGLIKSADLLNKNTIISSIKKTKTRQKGVQFKSSWSGELESTKRMSKDHLNYISTSKGNFIIKLNRMDIKSTCPVFFSGNFETDAMYTMFCEFKCDDEVYYTTKQYPIHGNSPTISMNEDINIPLTYDQNNLEINVMMIKKSPNFMPPQFLSKSSKNNSSSGMSTLTRTMSHSKKTIHHLMFWKKSKNSDGFSSVNSATMNGGMMNYGGFEDMNGNNLLSQKNDLQFRSLTSNSSISKMFASDSNGSNTHGGSSHHGRNHHPSVKTIFNNTNNNTSSSTIPSPSNGLSRESTMDCITGSNTSLNSTYSTNTNASSSLSSPDNIFVAGKIIMDLKELKEQHMGELIDDKRYEISPPKPIKNSNTNSELPPVGSVRIRKKVMQWDGLDVPLVILNGKLNMSVFYIPDFSYKEDLFVPKTISDCLDCVDCQRWHETETKSGYLLQKGGDVNDWNRRFYRLIGEKLIAFDSEASENKATIDLTQCKFINLLLPDPQNNQFINETLPNGEEYTTIVCLNPSACTNENYIFELVFKDDDAIEFKCESLEDMNAWCKELQIVVQEWEDFQYPNWWTEILNYKEEIQNKEEN